MLGRTTRPVSASARSVYYGVNLHPLQDRYALYAPAQTLQLAHEIGASVVRVDVHWGWIEYVRQAYGNFLAHLVRHVGRRIQYYEIWNEPNLTRFWAHPDPVVYTRLLQTA